MRKIYTVICSLLFVVLFSSLCTVCQAEESYAYQLTASSVYAEQSEQKQPSVTDLAGYLSSQERENISAVLERIRDTYNVDAAIVTVESYDQRNIQAAADDFYDYRGYGFGEDYSGFMLMICRKTREYYITTSGSSIAVINDDAIDYLRENVESYLKKDDYYSACKAFAEQAAEIYADYAAGKEFDSTDSKSDIVYYVFAWILAAVAALAATLFAKSTMNDAVKRTSANEYVKQGSVNITKANDVFLYSTVTKTKRVKQTSAGASTHTSSSGRTHGGGGGRF